MATKALPSSMMLVSENSPLLKAYRYRLAVSTWTDDEKPFIVNIVTNSITYANLTARQYNCLKYENGNLVVDFKASPESDEEIKEIVKEAKVKNHRGPGRPPKNKVSHSVAA